MTEPKTRPARGGVRRYLDGIADPQRRADCRAIARMMAAATGAQATMWGTAMVGFGRYRYRNASGREAEWFLTGFAARKQALTLYIMTGFAGSGELLAELGRHKTGKSCLYLRALDDVDRDVLRQLIERSVQAMREKYP